MKWREWKSLCRKIERHECMKEKEWRKKEKVGERKKKGNKIQKRR